MKIQTLSVLVGSQACNVHCPFCVSKMTPNAESLQPRDVNWRNLHVACRFAVRAGVTTAMLTGKGEPLLWPSLVNDHLVALQEYFPLLEIQTNGIRIASGEITEAMLQEYYRHGLTTIAVSLAHPSRERNSEIYGGHHFELPQLVELLHKESRRFSVRLSAVLLRGYLDRPERVRDLIRQAKEWGVEQVTLTPVNSPAQSANESMVRWVSGHRLTSAEVNEIRADLGSEGTKLRVLAHGAEVFDYEGQNVCLSNCLSTEPDETIRNLVFHPDGHLRTDWTHEGSILL